MTELENNLNTTEEVVESPVKLILKSDLAVGEPTLEVAL